MNLEENKDELCNEVEFGVCSEELREIMNNSEEDKSWKASRDLIRKESVDGQWHTIQEAISNDCGAAISGDFGNSGVRVHFRHNRKPTLTKRRWGVLNWEGWLDNH